MNDQQVRTKAILSELVDRWKQHESRYDGVLYRVALVRTDDGAWHPVVVFLSPRQTGITHDPPYRADYGNLLIVHGSLSVANADAMLEGILEREQLGLPEIPPVKVSAYLSPMMVRRHGSQERRFPIHYAAYEYHFQSSDGLQGGQVPQGYACAPSLPLYPNLYAAAEHLVGIPVINQGIPIIVALAPDYRARMKRVQLSGAGVTVEIETPGAGEGDLVGKVYCEDLHGSPGHFDLSFLNGAARFPTTSYPRRMLIALMSRSSGEIIDEWSYDSAMPGNSGVEIEATEESLENLIKGGESETLEFKEKMPDRLAIAKAISAFANSGGGRLLIGVNDSGQLIGCELEKLADKFTDIVHAHCDPAPPFSTALVTIRDTNIVVVGVEEGDNKPYFVKDQGIYVRVGATTRRANRYEMDRFYPAKQVLGPSWR